MNEQWRTIPGFDGLYEVSDHGRVRSIGRVVRKANGVLLTVPPKILRSNPPPAGKYHKVGLRKDGRTITITVHRAVLLAFVGPAPAGTEGCHNNGNPGDNRLSNLRWDTRSANNLDAVAHGTHYNAALQSCRRGHPFTPDNTRIRKYDGGRDCLTCERARRKGAA